MTQKILEIHVGSEFDRGPEVAVVEITEKLNARIRQLALAAKALGVYKIAEFDCSPDFYPRDDEVEEEDGPTAYREPADDDEEKACRTECVTLNVTPEDYFWSGLVKHTSIRWETEPVSLPDLDQAKPVFAVVLQGGLVQGIVLNHPALMKGWNVLVIDYDTEGAEDGEIFQVPKEDGTMAKALARIAAVEEAGIHLGQVVESLNR
jgi:hypothetical protein